MDRLIDFLESDVVPELEALERSSVSGLSDAATASRFFLADAFLWLHLGVEIGAFSEPAAREAFDEYFGPFFRLLSSQEAAERGGSPTEYVLHSDESWELVRAFPHFGGILIEKAMRGDGDLFSAQQNVFGNPRSLVGTFQSLLLLRDHIAHSPAARWFIRGINFASSELWRSAWRVECSPEEVIKADADASDVSEPSQALTFAGYLALYRYGLQMKDLFKACAEDPLLDSTDLSKLDDRGREMRKWLVNLTSSVAAERFEAVKSKLTLALRRQANTDDNITRAFIDEIERSMDEAMDFVGIPQLVA
jgi:hypothetical protein